MGNLIDKFNKTCRVGFIVVKKMGYGLQYDVYDYGERVLKIPRSNLSKTLNLLKWSFVDPSYLFFRKIIRDMNVEKIKSIKGLIKRKVDISLIGNPIFEKNKLWQDKVIPLKKIVHENPEIIFRKYSEFIVSLWKYGLQESVFNFGVNFGLDNSDRIVLIDFGELSFDKEQVIKSIVNKRWRKSHDFKYILNKQEKILYDNIMCSTLTIKRLNREWEKLLKESKK